MVAVGAADGAIVLRLCAEIYPLGAIRTATEAFSPHAAFAVETRGAYHEVTIVPTSGAKERLADELANYVLAVAAQGADAASAQTK